MEFPSEIANLGVACATVLFIGDKVAGWVKAARSNGKPSQESIQAARFQERVEAAHRELVAAQERVANVLDNVADKLHEGWCMRERA